MKAAILNRYGGIEHVALQDVDVPEIGPNEVLVRVTSASVNPLDLKLIHGYLKDFFPIPIPYPLGTDLFGTVVKAGSLVANWKPSDQVIGRLEPVPGPGRALKSRGGAFAEYVAMPVHQLASAPKGAKEGAGLPTAAGTAWQALFEIGGVEEGWEILIHAGAGGVGSFAIQLAKRAGARIMATASAGRLDLLARLGADEPVDYKETNFSRLAGKFDFVLDTIGGDTHAISFPLLRPGGKLVSIVHPPDEQLAKQHQVAAYWLAHTFDGARLAALSKLCADGTISVQVDSVFPLTEIHEALSRSATGRAAGKIIVNVDTAQG